MNEPTNEEIKRQFSDALIRIDHLTTENRRLTEALAGKQQIIGGLVVERDALVKECDNLRHELNHIVAAVSPREEIGRKWQENSSLENWFPITAEQIAALTKERDELKAENSALQINIIGRKGLQNMAERERDTLRSKLERAEAYRAELFETVADLATNCQLSERQVVKVKHALSTTCGTNYLAPEKVERLRNALVGVLPFAFSYRSHQLRNVNDKLEERLEAAKQAITETEP